MSVIFGESKKRQLESCPFLGDEAFRGVLIKKFRFIELPSEAFTDSEEETNSIRKGHSLTLANMFPDTDDKVIIYLVIKFLIHIFIGDIRYLRSLW